MKCTWKVHKLQIQPSRNGKKPFTEPNIYYEEFEHVPYKKLSQFIWQVRNKLQLDSLVCSFLYVLCKKGNPWLKSHVTKFGVRSLINFDYSLRNWMRDLDGQRSEVLQFGIKRLQFIPPPESYICENGAWKIVRSNIQVSGCSDNWKLEVCSPVIKEITSLWKFDLIA